MLLYIHGFRSTTKSYKSLLFKKYFKDNLIVCDHPVKAGLAVKYMERLMDKNTITGIIASSLGGFYATYLSEKYSLKTVLINPSVIPYETTRIYLGKNTTFDNENFIWEESDLKNLSKIAIKKPTAKNYLLFLQTGDDVLDYKVALNFYKGSKIILENGGSHTFDNIDKYLSEIENFLITYT